MQVSYPSGIAVDFAGGGIRSRFGPLTVESARGLVRSWCPSRSSPLLKGSARAGFRSGWDPRVVTEQAEEPQT